MSLQPQLPLPHHRHSTCRRHPTKHITGFCAACLREGLAGIDSPERREISADNQHSAAELLRSKSFSSAKREAILHQSEQVRRKSCDVRARNTLVELFNIDDKPKGTNNRFEVGLGNLGFELRENVGNERAIRGCEEVIEPEIDAEDDFFGEEAELRPMKEFIDLELRRKKNTGIDLGEIAGGVWEAASVFSKKIRRWRQKQKMNKLEGDSYNAGGLEMEAEKPNIWPFRETQSEIGDYGLGRRSCDTDPRTSIDIGRISLDNSRYSIDEPRASWDGYFLGRAYPPLKPPMVSVLNEQKVSEMGLESRISEEGEKSPGGSAQTKDYYMDSLSSVRRRRSFDQSNSHRKSSISEADELKLISNAKVSPATTELFYGAKVLITEEDLKGPKSRSIKDGDLDSTGSSASKVEIDQKKFKRAHRWHKMWNVFGLMQKRSESKCKDRVRGEIANGVDDQNHPFSESWQKLRRVANREANGSGSVSQKLIRSYSVSCNKDSSKMAAAHGISGAEIKGNNKGSRRRGEESLALQRNRSVGYSPNNPESGLLRFYLTPLRSYRRSKSGKSRLKNSNYMATRNVL